MTVDTASCILSFLLAVAVTLMLCLCDECMCLCTLVCMDECLAWVYVNVGCQDSVFAFLHIVYAHACVCTWTCMFVCRALIK